MKPSQFYRMTWENRKARGVEQTTAEPRGLHRSLGYCRSDDIDSGGTQELRKQSDRRGQLALKGQK